MSGIAGDAAGVQTTFSSWDSCMTKAYCKWPAIIGIIIGSLVVLSLIWCLARCLCCGAECCCGCLSCLSCCCPNGGRRRERQGSQPPPQTYQPYPQQYQSQPPPMYGGYAQGNGYRGAQTATFDASSTKDGAARYNEDALPAMPSWANATAKHVEEEPEDVEMQKLDHPQQQPLLSEPDNTNSYPYQTDVGTHSGDLGIMGGANRYYQHDQPQQPPNPRAYMPSSYDRQSSHVASPTASMYTPANGFQSQGMQQPYYGAPQSPYEPNIAPSYHMSAPSYHTSAPSYHTSAPSYQTAAPAMASGQIGRKPVYGSWRDV